MLGLSYHNGEHFITFDVLAINHDRNEITVVVTNQGKITQQTFDLINEQYFFFGSPEQRIYLADFELV